MTRYQYEEPITPDFSQPWVQRRLEQLEGHFHDFLISKQGRLYVLFGGRRAGKTSLLHIIHHRYPPEPGEKLLSVFVDLTATGVLSSPKDVFRLLFDEIRRQLGICYIDPREDARLFQDSGLVLSDFKQAFHYIAWFPESKVHGARLLLLLDNADELARASFAPELFAALITLFSNPTYIQHVTSQLDVIVAGGRALYNQLLEAKVPRKLKHWYSIETLPKDAAQALITALPAIQNQPAVVDEILRYTGGQPYLLQYFMAKLEDLTIKRQPVTHESVERVAAACLQPRSEPAYWLHDCFEAMQEQGACPVYAALADEQPMTWKQIRVAIQEQKLGDMTPLLDPIEADRALDTLLFHGLIRHDPVPEIGAYVITSELFKQWFVERRGEQDEASLQIQLKEARDSLRLIEERKTQYVLEVDVPLQLIKEERRLSGLIAELEARLAQQSSLPTVDDA